MGFLHALFLAGTASFAIPVAIHLLFKVRKKRLFFSSLRFLEQSTLQQARRLRVREWLLLLLRALACILIALAFTRPYDAGALKSGQAQQLQDIVLVLDDSPSMLARQSGQSRFEWSKAQQLALLQTLQPGDRAALILTSSPSRPEVERTGNFGGLEKAIADLAVSPLRGSLTDALRTAAGLLADSNSAVRRVVVFSDLQLNQTPTALWQQFVQQMNLQQIGLELETPGGDEAFTQAGRLRNLSIGQVRARSDIWIPDQPISFLVRVVNHSRDEVSQLALRMLVNEQVIAQRSLSLGPSDAVDVELKAVFPQAGEVYGRMEIDAQDAFPEDDRFYFAFYLRNGIACLILEDRLRERQRFLEQSYYLRMALQPRPKTREGDERTTAETQYISANVRSIEELTPQLLQQYDLVMLAGVSEIDPNRLRMLEQVVREGLHLAIFADRTEGTLSEAFYNGPFWADGMGLLPARISGRYEGSVPEDRYDGLDSFDETHPIFLPFVGAFEADLRAPRFWRHQEFRKEDLLVQTEGREPRAPGKVLATFNAGTPFLVERAFGKGRVLAFPFIPRPEWTDLPRRRTYVALMHQLVRYLAGNENEQRRMLISGAELIPALQSGNAMAQCSILRPAPWNDTVVVAGAESLWVDHPGLYAVRTMGSESAVHFWAVNRDPLESDLQTESVSSVRAALSAGKVVSGQVAVNSSQELTDEWKSRSPYWRMLLLAAILCLIGEALLRDYWRS